MFVCFKRRVAYELRISDWSSDVCFSELLGDGPDPLRNLLQHYRGIDGIAAAEMNECLDGLQVVVDPVVHLFQQRFLQRCHLSCLVQMSTVEFSLLDR